MKKKMRIQYIAYYLAPFVFNTLLVYAMWIARQKVSVWLGAVVWLLMVVCNEIWAHFTLNSFNGDISTPFLSVLSYWYGHAMLWLVLMSSTFSLLIPSQPLGSFAVGMFLSIFSGDLVVSSIVLFIVCAISSNWRKRNKDADYSPKVIGKAPRCIVAVVVIIPLLCCLVPRVVAEYHLNRPYTQTADFERWYCFRADAGMPLGKNENNQRLSTLDGLSQTEFVYVHIDNGLKANEKGVIYKSSDAKQSWEDFPIKSLSVAIEDKRTVIEDKETLRSLVSYVLDDANRLTNPNVDVVDSLELWETHGEWLGDTGNASLYFDFPCNLYRMFHMEITKDNRVTLAFSLNDMYYYDVTHILGEYFDL